MTRPREAADRFVRQLDQSLLARVRIVYSPLIAISAFREPVVLDGYRGLIFSSVNGVLAAAKATARRDLPVFCVGPATTLAASEAGWIAREAGQDADSLVAALAGDPPDGPLLHLRGEHGRGAIAERLSDGGVITDEQVLYRQTAQSLSAEALVFLDGDGEIVAPIFSPRTARLFNAAAPDRKIIICALSPVVAAEFDSRKNAVVDVAEAPNAQTMSRLVENRLHSLLAG